MKTNKILMSAFALTVAFASLTSCGKDDPATPLPQIGGYDNAGQVAKVDLVAYWPLDGDGKESISGTLPATTVGTTWTTGVKGQGANLTAGYMDYPTIATLSANMNAYTISAWFKVKNNQTPTSGSASVFLSLTRPNEWEGNINFFAETGQRPAIETSGVVNDSIKLKNTFRSTTSGGENYDNIGHLETWMVADNLVTPGKHVAGPNVVGGIWAHGVITWDGATNKLIIYVNGQKITNPAFEVRGSNTSIVFDTPTHAIIGAYGNVAGSTDVWNKPMTGQLDEIRLWKKALSVADINALYDLEKAGR